MKTCSQIKKKIASVCLRKICDVMIGYLIIATIVVILVRLLLYFYDVLDVSTIFANIVTCGMFIVLFLTYSSKQKEKRKKRKAIGQKTRSRRKADNRCKSSLFTNIKKYIFKNAPFHPKTTMGVTPLLPRS